ncbi:hypothetical protein ACWDV7_26080 [Streptomyces sp. NPDC003362]
MTGSLADARRRADDLVELLRAEEPAQLATAERLRGELARAEDEGEPVDRGRVRNWLIMIREGAATSAGVVALVTSLGQLLGV